jgi:CHASE2 domain-containing sensor protein
MRSILLAQSTNLPASENTILLGTFLAIFVVGTIGSTIVLASKKIKSPFKIGVICGIGLTVVCVLAFNAFS